MAVDPDNSAPAKKKVLIGLGLLALIVVFVASCSSSWSRCGDYDRDIVHTYSPGRGDYDRRGSDYVYRPDGTGDYRREIRYIYNPNGGAYDLKNGEYVYVGCSKRNRFSWHVGVDSSDSSSNRSGSSTRGGGPGWGK